MEIRSSISINQSIVFRKNSLPVTPPTSFDMRFAVPQRNMAASSFVESLNADLIPFLYTARGKLLNFVSLSGIRPLPYGFRNHAFLRSQDFLED